MIEKGLLAGDLTVTRWVKLQKVRVKTQVETGDGPMSNAERQPRYREKCKQQGSNDVYCNDNIGNDVTQESNGVTLKNNVTYSGSERFSQQNTSALYEWRKRWVQEENHFACEYNEEH